MHIDMWLLHPAAADHSVSISRQQVQRIFSFSLRSWAVTSFCSWLLLTSEFNELSTLFGRLSCWWTALQRWWFFPCRVDCTHQAALPPVCVADDHLPCALQHARAWAVSMPRWRSWMSHLLTVDAHLGVAARLSYLDKGVELLPPSRSSSGPGCRQARSTSGGSTAGLRITVEANSWTANGTCWAL